MIMDFAAYMKACHEHLESQTPDGHNYYAPVNERVLQIAHHKLSNLLDEGFDNNYITKEEHNAMLPPDMTPGKFYATFKVHKKHT